MSIVYPISRLYNHYFGRKYINYSTLRKNGNKNRKSLIGDGGFGITFKNGNNGVFKLYFIQKNKENRHNPNVNYNRASQMVSITGNTNQRLEVVKGFKMTNLPQNVKERLTEIGKMPANNANLPVIHMPYLGFDLYAAINETNIATLRAIPISTLMLQCYELIKQIDKIRNARMCHGDIKLDNIVIHPETGKMTLIDFDIFGNFESRFYNYYSKISSFGDELSPYIPPEFICIRAIRDTIVSERKDNTKNSIVTRSTSFSKSMFLKYKKGGILQFLKFINIDTEEEGEEYFFESFNSNIALLDKISKENKNINFKLNTINKETMNYFMNYFDYYGFGMVMTMFFNTLYPKNILESKNNLERKTFNNMLQLLKSMCDFSLKNRPEPDEIHEKMGRIMYDMTGENADFDYSNENENRNEKGKKRMSNTRKQKKDLKKAVQKTT